MGPGDRQIDRERDRETETSERQTKCLMCRGIEGEGGESCHTFTYTFSYLFGYEKTEDCKVYTHTRRTK